MQNRRAMMNMASMCMDSMCMRCCANFEEMLSR